MTLKEVFILWVENPQKYSHFYSNDTKKKYIIQDHRALRLINEKTNSVMLSHEIILLDDYTLVENLTQH